MRNPHGWPIWYELMTADPQGSIGFYEQLFGWTIGPRPDGPLDYRMLDTPDGQVGGLLVLTPEMQEKGGRQSWLFYVGVDDVDAAVAAAQAAGGTVVMAATDLPGVGRFAMLADPFGAPFYLMRGEPDDPSTAYDRMSQYKCSWNELTTPDQAAANDFYARLFGWRYPDRMPMGPLGDYVFVEAADRIIGATMPKSDEQAHSGWTFYFRVTDIDAAAQQVGDGGGTLLAGPMEVPGGEKVIVAMDPYGAVFGAVAAAETEA